MLATAIPTALGIDIENAKRVGNLAPCVLWTSTSWKKVPVNTAGRRVNPLDPANQITFANAAAAYVGLPSCYSGIGIVLTDTPRADGMVLTVLDYDAKGNISNKERSRRDRVAEDHTALFNSYTETSVSGKGRHIVIWARPIGRNLKLGDHGEIEVFQAKRFVALTGHMVDGAKDVRDRANELDKLLASLSGRSGGCQRTEPPAASGYRADFEAFGPLATQFQGLPVENELAAGIDPTMPRTSVKRRGRPVVCQHPPFAGRVKTIGCV